MSHQPEPFFGVRIRPADALSETQADKLRCLLLSFGMSRSQADQLIRRMGE